MQKILIPLFIIFAVTIAVFWRPILRGLDSAVPESFRPGSFTEETAETREFGGTSIFQQLRGSSSAPKSAESPFSLDRTDTEKPAERMAAISSIRLPSSSRPSLVRIDANLPKGEEISLAGWKLKSNQGEFFFFGGAALYNPPYASPPSSPIMLGSGDRVLVTNGPNPLMANLVFRPNRCFGYLARERSFPLSVPSSCPGYSPPLSSVSYLSPSCQSFILNLRECEVPNPSSVSGVGNNLECLAYLKERFTYKACLQEHRNDEDFLKNEWHVYTPNELLHPVHDTLRLIDEKGVTVDEYVY